MAAFMFDDRGIVVPCGQCGQKNRLAYERLGDSVRCGRCKHELAAPSVPIDIATTADFDRLIAHASVPVAVDYWAPWCGPCRMVAPELEKVAARNAGRFLVVKVNTDVLTELGERYAIRSIPTLAVFAGGREVSRTAGARPANDIESFVRSASETLHHEKQPH
jgi:thioredoxin 2